MPRDDAGFWRTFLTVLVTSALLLVIALAVAFQVVPRIVGGTSLTVLSGSMSPTIHAGDLIAVRSVDPADLRMGDIITFQPVSNDPDLVTHRVVGIGYDTVDGLVFSTRGDANGATDAPIVAAQVRGVYMYGMPFVGGILALASPIAGPLVAVLGIALIGYAVFAFVRPHRRVSAGALALLLALGAAVAGADPPSAAAADELDVTFTGPTVNLGWSGQTYETAEASFFGDRIVSPGDRIARSVQVVNNGPTGAALRAKIVDASVLGELEDVVKITWQADASSGGSTFGDVRAGDQVIADALPVVQGATLTLTLILEFPIDSTEQSQAAVDTTTLDFDVLFVLEETLPDGPEPEDPLPPTGGVIALGLLVGALVAVSAGIALVLQARSRRRAQGGAEPRR